ncbi:MAG: S-layer homology domain-containing protein [Oscillospiraceae bacterium]|nr:S-layer homology domain-containing protein [Oscillospiraceae bacterium]
MSDRYFIYPTTIHVSDALGRSMVFEGMDVVSSTMDEADFYDTGPSGPQRREIYVNPGSYTFTLSEKESGLNNEMHLCAYLNDMRLQWYASELSDSDSVTFAAEGDEFRSIIIKSEHTDKNFCVKLYSYTPEGTVDYDIELAFEMRDTCSTVTKVEGGTTLEGAVRYTLTLAKHSENVIAYAPVEIGYAKIYLDERTEDVTFLTYADVPEDAWYYDTVYDMKELGLMTGTSSRDFSPQEHLSRGMFLTVLQRMGGLPDASVNHSFPDVSAQKYYSDAVSWGVAHGLVAGYSDTSFAPEDPVTREQLAVILVRYLEARGIAPETVTDIAADTFSDYDEISADARAAVGNAVQWGLLSGRADNRLNPQDPATRAETAVVLQRLLVLTGDVVL